MNINENFQWQRCPEAEAQVSAAIEEAVTQNCALKRLSDELLSKTSSRLFDWVDHVVSGDLKSDALEKTGFRRVDGDVFEHPGAQLPRFILSENEGCRLGVAVSVESLADFLLVHGQGGHIEGAPYSAYRRALIAIEEKVAFWVVERRSLQANKPTYPESEAMERDLERTIAAEERWAIRPRYWENEEEGMLFAIREAKELVNLVGEAMAASIVLKHERSYWQARNRAGQLQKNRQDSLGMGWANHDHHTFRSSRAHFQHLVHFFEILGFRLRERFYAGKEAGWGAQVMDHPGVRLVLFLDVDLLPEELAWDFAHVPLKPAPSLGTIGLWCALHGDSLLQAGMHHLEAQFLFDELQKDLHSLGVSMMEPFSHFSYLKQAFTQGEMWPVAQARLASLAAANLITPEQKAHFATFGALGSHLENLQRREGYKGFNQKNVSFIIEATDPRRN